MSTNRVITSLVLLIIMMHITPMQAQQQQLQSPERALQRVIEQILAQLNSTARHLRTPIRLNSSLVITPHTSNEEDGEEEGKVRLVGGKTLFEGNVEVRHRGRWGSICDDQWQLAEATVACRQMGFVLGARKATTGSRYGQAKKLIWMSNLSCKGIEDALQDCPFPGWQKSTDCSGNEAAGVICRTQRNHQRTSTAADEDADVEQSTRTSKHRPIVTSPTPFNETSVFSVTTRATTPKPTRNRKPVRVTRRRRLRSQQARNKTSRATTTTTTTTTTTETPETDPPEMITTSTGVDLPDLVPDAVALEESAFIEDRSILFLQCAMEENCLSKSAYQLDKSDPSWIFGSRRLLRFTAAIHNIGQVDFRPHTPKSDWIWHSCHRHYHSMEVFAHFDLFNLNTGERVAEGHKASFCLEDNLCKEDARKRFVCANYGDQGISVGCVDIYKYDLDCQWIDITDISPGAYRMQVRINPEQAVPEASFENNAVSCHFLYTPIGGLVSNCSLGGSR